MLFAEDISHTLSHEEQKQFIFEQVNKIRTQYDLKIFTLDEELSQAAERMVSKAASKKLNCEKSASD